MWTAGGQEASSEPVIFPAKDRPARSEVVVVLLVSLVVPAAAGADYPAKPIRLIVPLAPGGGNDTTARLFGARLGESLGQPVVIENRPGAGSVIASDLVAKAPADGYTLYLISTSFTAAPALVKKLPFDPLGDFTHLTRLAVVPGALIVHASLPVRSVKEYIALARTHPGAVTFGSAGIGSASHLGGDLFRIRTGVSITHVPYKGSSLVTTALLSGEISSAFTNPISSMPHVKAGRIRNLGLTSLERWPLLPDYPTLSESGVKGYELLVWNGVSVRAGTPTAIVDRLHGELVRAAQAPDIVTHMAQSGARPMTQSPADFGAFVRNEIRNWQRVAEASAAQTR